MIMTSSSAWRADGDGFGFASPQGRQEFPGPLLRSINRHLAVAATQLARADGVSDEEAARYTAAGARFRALVELDGNLRSHIALPIPVAETAAGEAVTLPDLLADLCRREQVQPPLRSIDPELVHQAKQLLCGVLWRVPDRPIIPGREVV